MTNKPVKTLRDLFADAQVPNVEDVVLEGGQLDHHVLVLPEDVLGSFFVANLEI